MSDKRQKNQLVLAFTEEGRSEAPRASREGTESHTAKCETERPASHEQLMEEVCGRENCWQAYKRVKANKGSPGIDGMTVGELSGYLKQHWPSIREQLLCGTYQPQPVRRVEIPKPDGGVRKLGIPTVLDRLIQQAVMQVLQRRWDPTFSEHSHGFRPKRSAHQAVAKAQQYIAAGHRWVVDLDLGKFFDRVNHDKLMAAIARRVTDKRVLRVIGAFLKVGVLENGLVSPAEEGTPQGGPLSPLLSNIVLARGISLEQMMKELAAYLRGWKSYFGFCQTPALLKALDEWIRRRLRSMIWKQWKRGKQRYAKLRHLGIGRDLAARTAGSPHGPWHLANSPALSYALPIAYFVSLGLPRLLDGDA
jgi:retron-type reverse transcriptase